MPHQISLNSLSPQKTFGGWTEQPTEQYQDFPLYTTKRQMREGIRYHMAKFVSKKAVDPSNQEEFTRPLLLHRRDPKQGPPGKSEKDDQALAEDVPMDSKERERQEILREQKEKQKALDLAQIAPTGTSGSAVTAKKAQAFRNEKTTQVHRLDKTEAEKRQSDLRYEEALPWHLEDADNKNTWVGNYEAALSETNVIFVAIGDRFVMIPIEKWYQFKPKGQFKAFTIEEAEATLNKKTKESRWVMRTNEQNETVRSTQETRKLLNPLYTVKAESGTFRNSSKRETQDMDDLDFNEDDLFQDDDEQHTVEKVEDEETKEAQDRIKREQLAANIFDQADEAEVDQELQEEEKEAEKLKKFGKDVKKALKKRERNFIYDSDSDHPYSDVVSSLNTLLSIELRLTPRRATMTHPTRRSKRRLTARKMRRPKTRPPRRTPKRLLVHLPKAQTHLLDAQNTLIL
jgi:transcription initiation factor TFIIF subunit alpha